MDIHIYGGGGLVQEKYTFLDGEEGSIFSLFCGHLML